MSSYGLKVKWLSVACFELVKDGKHIVTDPFVTLSDNSPCTWEDIEGCDLITLSHVHWDHVPDIPALMRKFPGAPLLTGELSALPLIEWGNLIPQDVWPMESNLELDFDWVKAKALFGRHTAFGETRVQLLSNLSRKPFCDKAMGDMQILGTMEYRNFLFTFPDGTKILIWGNDFTPVQINIVKALKPDIAFIQSTRQLNDLEGYARFVHESGAKVVIPHHMDLKKPYEEYKPLLKKAEEAIKELSPEVEFVLPEYGKYVEV
ncbi:MAG: MBL fold metallo-hydrolase [Eubacteriales bacterium]|nr:MBL fold metallo-hydrolase [Eubacteriales bacterium]